MIILPKNTKTLIIFMGVFVFNFNILNSQPKNTNFSLSQNLDSNVQFDLFYYDEDIADTYARELSLILSNELSLRNVSINYPVDFKEIKNGDIISVNDYASKNQGNIILYVNSQSSSTRNNIKGFIYFNNKLIGSFSSHRTIWNNNRLIALGEFLAQEISKKSK
jgi:hypothetical protein